MRPIAAPSSHACCIDMICQAAEKKTSVRRNPKPARTPGDRARSAGLCMASAATAAESQNTAHTTAIAAATNMLFAAPARHHQQRAAQRETDASPDQGELEMQDASQHGVQQRMQSQLG